MVKGENIHKIYRTGDVEVHALRGVNFEIYDGEFIVILGPSGSGKSTLLNVVGGLETAEDGVLTFRGETVDWGKKSFMTEYRRKHIGFVFQFYNLLPGLTALENVELAGELSSDPLDPKKLIEDVGLADRAKNYPSSMSGGQQQRVAIARALCKNPDVLLCDEPTGALDSKTSVQVLKLLWDFNRNYKKPIIMVTHNADIARIANRVFYFKDGVIDHIAENQNPENPEEINW
ncbi:MAG: ABC transporter ATP-binding protein [Sphaerochaetaceae bacterium]|nr:ABC transporter ATP-binding protein [Sphaerochaetaceae bacterium]